MDDLQVRSTATDILSYLVEFSPAIVQDFALQEARQSENVSKSSLEIFEYTSFRANRKTTSKIKSQFLCLNFYFKIIAERGELIPFL